MSSGNPTVSAGASEEPGETSAPDDIVADAAAHRGEPPSASLKSGPANWLDVHGGFVLLFSGAALIALACIFSERAAIAPVFAASGAVLIVLAAFYSRIEGPVQATREGIAIAVKAAQRLSREQELPADLEAEVVERAVDRLEIPSRKPSDIQRAGEAAAREAVESLTLTVHEAEQHLRRGFASWLATEAAFSTANITEHAQSPQGEIDLVAEKPDEIMIVEIKARTSYVNVGTIYQLLSRAVPDEGSSRHVRRALVIPADQPISLGVIERAKMSEIEIYEVWPDGRVHRVI